MNSKEGWFPLFVYQEIQGKNATRENWQHPDTRSRQGAVIPGRCKVWAWYKNNRGGCRGKRVVFYTVAGGHW